MKSRTLDLVYGAIYFVIAIVLYWVSLDLSSTDRSIASDPAWFPRLLLGMLLIAAIVLMVQAQLRQSSAQVISLRVKALIITLGAAGLYLVGFYEIGFIQSTLVLIPVLSWLLGYRRPFVIIAVTIIFTCLLWYAFTLLLNVNPPGLELPVPV